MLYLVRGRAGSGKTKKIREIIAELTLNKNSKPLLIVPEQFSFETERAILKLLGAKRTKGIDIFSFPRMALSYLQNTGNVVSDIPDNGVKAALMSETLTQLDGKLNIFSNIKHNSVGLNPLIDFCKELKYCCIDSDRINSKLDLMDDCFLKEKLKELDLISTAYDALLSQSYFNDTDALILFKNLASESGYFKNKTVFLDGFRTFTKQESECLSIAFSQADDVYITLCADNDARPFSALYYMRDFEKKIKNIAAQCGVGIKVIQCKQPDNVFSDDIFTLEKSIYSRENYVKEKSDGNINVVCCSDKEDECRYVACEIKKLLRTGNYRCRDIAVIERTNGTYKSDIVEALKRLSVPVFDDSRRPLINETLFVYVIAALDCVANGFTTENLMRYLKTGLTPLSVQEVSRLEKYALVWGIGAKAWQNEFTMHPDGFGGSFTDETKTQLSELNVIRKKAVSPLVYFKEKCKDADGKTISKALYEFLIDSGVREKLYDLTFSLESSGFPVEANRCEASWNFLMNIIDTMAVLTDKKYYSLKRWNELFMILVSSGDMGEIPQGLDEVTVGCADRIRTEKLKVVFLVGVNKDEFPLVNVQNGILTDADRVTLTNLGLEVRPPFENTVDEERFIAYCAVTAASEKLYLTYKTNDGSGTSLSYSEIIEAVYSCIEDVNTVVTSALPQSYFIESDSLAFSVFAKNYTDKNTLHSTLASYLEKNDSYKGKLSALATAGDGKPFKFADSEISKKLFGEQIYISASKVENFYNCPFAYFMRYGLGAEPLRTAALDPAQSGTIVHLVMERVLSEFPHGEFISAEEKKLRETVKGVLNEYLEEKMGGVEEKSKRFMFLFNRLEDVSMAIIDRLKAEFADGSFKPCDFELRIGGEEVPAYNLSLEEGSVKITGSVDRVDMMEKDGIKYIRVVDYKTGQKEFKLSELFDGLNIQMVLYLMALEKNGKGYYGDIIPAGVLYLPSRIGVKNYLDSRSPSPENIAAQKRISGKLSGMVLDSPVVFNGMGVDKHPDYFPVSYKKDGSPKDNYYSLTHFKNLSSIIDKKIISMGEALHKGDIGAVPCGSNGEGKMCAYCSYKAVCGREQTGEVSEITKLTHLQALERLDGENDE